MKATSRIVPSQASDPSGSCSKINRPNASPSDRSGDDVCVGCLIFGTERIAERWHEALRWAGSVRVRSPDGPARRSSRPSFAE